MGRSVRRRESERKERRRRGEMAIVIINHEIDKNGTRDMIDDDIIRITRIGGGEGRVKIEREFGGKEGEIPEREIDRIQL